MLLTLTLMLVCCTSIKGTLSLDTSLSNACVNTFAFSLTNEPADASTGINESNDKDVTKDTNVNTNAKTGDDTMLNIVLIGMLVSIVGLAICWTRENKEN
ncbi:MAG: hypothetical protein LUG60_00350 [Erysipelotrichaceae bacterium]|nr:hypothetical protein [Erysipelotrichaceae bacterium]